MDMALEGLMSLVAHETQTTHDEVGDLARKIWRTQ